MCRAGAEYQLLHFKSWVWDNEREFVGNLTFCPLLKKQQQKKEKREKQTHRVCASPDLHEWCIPASADADKLVPNIIAA